MPTIRPTPHGVPVTLALAIMLTPLASPSLQAQCPATGKGPLPLSYAGPQTVAAVTACDLMTRLYIFADDSMRGRKAGSDDQARATDYIVKELKRLGLKPAGDSGSYYQSLPMVMRALDTTSTIVAGSTVLKAGTDFLVTTTAMHMAEFKGIRLAYGGALLDTTIAMSPQLADNTIVLFRPVPQGTDQAAIQRTQRGKDWTAWYATIRNRATANAAQLSAASLKTATVPTAAITLVEQGTTIALTLTTDAAERLFGGKLENLVPGTLCKGFTLNLRYIDTPKPNRTVVAVLPGSDATLKGQYVALGAHTDHLGLARTAYDHDSLRAYHLGTRAGAEGAASKRQVIEDDEYDRIHLLVDSLHKDRPVRRDSVYNGADDSGSGTVALLEIAEQFAKAATKPKRSLLFVWYTGTEGAPTLAGSTWFADHPSVPRTAIVANLSVDMIGRGAATDEIGVMPDEMPRFGNPDFLEILGPSRGSSELGQLIAQVNTDAKLGLKLDLSGDVEGHPDGIFCRNDAASFVRFGIPTAIFTTGYHADFREITDEPQYIQYQHMLRNVQLVAATTLKLANLDHAPALDRPKPDPKGRCIP